ncbi:hypothetical protein BUALT_Bualt12G0105800 [Buddleja alternifolia]|uniref:Pentatricopeptide repeat-containing protein n=1 Tax=Buddleja alternifolia TaxID=168488 RepID=A0AAV6X0W8_9LAMI|nr:hypothetical protein BUALT_Bualt12G0105800 [Buddleja alternifolia]
MVKVICEDGVRHWRMVLEGFEGNGEECSHRNVVEEEYLRRKWLTTRLFLERRSVSWSIEFGAHRNGSPEIHDMIADYIYSESPEVDMAKVSYHFVRGKDPKKFALTLVNFMGKCYPGEDDLAVARAVLMYLSLGNLRDANVLMDEMKKQVQFREIDFPRSELMQLINYLLKTLQRDALPLFNMLRQRYKSSIDREPMFHELFDEVANKFYGVQRKNSMPGMFGDFFKMMSGE